MKLMKKLSLLVALALIVTVGGVYATWNYAQGAAGQGKANLVPKLAASAQTNSKGAIQIDTTGLSILIDDIGAQDHVAELVMTGSVKVTFAPASGADSDVVAQGIPMQYQLSILYNQGQNEGTWVYDDNCGVGEKPIMTVVTTAQQVNSGNPTLSFEIPAVDLLALIDLGHSFKLDEFTDYENFNSVLGRAQIQLTVSEITP